MRVLFTKSGMRKAVLVAAGLGAMAFAGIPRAQANNDDNDRHYRARTYQRQEFREGRESREAGREWRDNRNYRRDYDGDRHYRDNDDRGYRR